MLKERITGAMHPLIAILLITLDPFYFPRNLFHTNYAVLIIFIVFVALQAEYILIFDAILQVF